jgi:peptidoglycan/xylan/chitin deacetylase (PgdA/CDA1 family)
MANFQRYIPLKGYLHQWVRSVTGYVVVLLYHRITSLSSDPQLLSVTPQHFSEHLEVLRQDYTLLSLDDLLDCMASNQWPKRGVVITFDDGYADNLFEAKPLLVEFDIPATVFVVSGYLGKIQEFWWDDLDRILLQPGILPEILRLDINGSRYEWTLDEATKYSKETFTQQSVWNILMESEFNGRQSIYRSLCQLLRSLTESQRRKVLDDIYVWAGVNSTGRLSHRTLSVNDMLRLFEDDLISIGAHTVTHPLLSSLPTVKQRAEIEQSKQNLEEILGSSVTSFSYPYGTRTDYTLETVDAVKKSGFVCAFSNFEDVVWRRTDFFQIPRILIRDWNGDEFDRRLREWFPT